MLDRIPASIACWLVLNFIVLAPHSVFAQQSDTGHKPAPEQEASEPTPEQAARLKEHDELAVRAKRLQGEGKLAEAIEVAKKVLDIEREIVGDEDAKIADTYDWIGGTQEAAEDYSEAEKSRQSALDLLTKLHGAGDWRVADARLALEHTRLLEGLDENERKDLRRLDVMNQRVVELRAAGKFREALSLAQDSLEIVKTTLGKEHRFYAFGLNELAYEYHSLQDYAHAEPLYRQALEIYKNVLGEEHPSYAGVLNNLAVLYLETADYTQAEPLLRRALEIRRKVLGGEHSQYAHSLNNLASLYHETGDYVRAEPLSREALEIAKTVLGEEHPNYATCLNNLAELYRDMADYGRAESFYRQAIEVERKVLGEEHPDYAASLNNLALLYEAMGDFSQAEPLYLQALAITRSVLGEVSPNYASGLNNLAELYRSMGDDARAEPLVLRALEIKKRALGEEHPDYAISLNSVAGLYASKGDYDRAEPLYRQTLEILKKVLGEEHPKYAASLDNLALLYDEMRDYSRAEPLYRQALEIRKNVLGEEHPDYATSLNNLAALYHEIGDDARAEPLLLQAMAIDKNVLGEDHPDFALSLGNLAMVYESAGDDVQAERHDRHALEITKKVLGEGHPDYVLRLKNLAVLYHRMGEHTRSLARLHDAAAAYEAARLRMAAKALDRAAFGVRRSPYLLLAAAEAGHGDVISAWDALESDLARGLLDEAASRAGLQLTAAEERERNERTAELEKLQPQILKLVTQIDPSDDAKAELAALLEQRSAAETRLSQLAAALSQRQVADLKDVQAALPADGAFVTWVDFSTKDRAVQEHWGCVLRNTGEPAWVRLPGAGANGAWTDEDDGLPKRQREALAKASSDNVENLSRQLATQRIAPLLPHLEGASRLFVAAIDTMAGVPVEALTDQFTVSYTPSGTQLVRLRERERPSGQATLLALGDPVFSQPGDSANDDGNTPAPARLPPGGLLITQVVPDGNAAKARLEAGDVLLAYAGAELETLEQLDELLAAHAGDESVTITVWRESQTQTNERQLGAGKLGVVLSREPAPAAIAHRRETDLLLASVARGKVWHELPGTRVEIAGLAELFDSNHVTLLADSDASEQQLAAMRESGALVQFRYVHLATHGQVNQKSAFESALILAQDHLSTADDVAAGAPFYDGRLTANEILQHWKLNAELVTLSSCESGLGRAGGGEGFLGFAQALLLAGSRSVCLSLWEVDDTATALLMARFYQDLLGKRDGLDSPLPKAKALAEAKAWLRTLTVSQAADLAANLSHGIARGAGHKTTVVGLNPPPGTESNAHPYDHPYYWAAFVLIGDPE